MSETIIEIKNASYIYGKNNPKPVKALDGISLSIEKGKITGIIGHTGSGKSTLLQLMNGLLTPDSGEIFIDGEKISEKGKNLRELRFRVGLVFQYPEYQLFEESVSKDIAYGPENMGLNADEIKKRVKEAMYFVGLPEEYEEKSPFDLSGGEKRRCAIAGIIAMEPEVLVLDEPAAGLDPIGKREIFEGILKYRKEKENSSVIIVSHSMEDIAEYCERVVVLEQGKVMFTGTPGEVFARSRELQESGLGLPQITKIMVMLREQGLDVRSDIYSVDDAADEIIKAARGEKC